MADNTRKPKKGLHSLFSRLSKPSITADPVSTAHEDSQSLGSPVGRYDIMCKLEGRKSKEFAPKWFRDVPNSEVRGLLYFQLQFLQTDGPPLDSATVRIELLGHPVNKPIPRVDTHAPKKAIEGPAIARLDGQHALLQPEFGINAGVAGANAKAGQWGDNSSGVKEKWWSFQSADRSGQSTRLTQMAFIWRCGWDYDQDGRNRLFMGALIVERGCLDEHLVLRVHVEAKPTSGFQTSNPLPRSSDPIKLPQVCLDSDEFDKLHEDLEEQIVKANENLGGSVVSRRRPRQPDGAQPAIGPSDGGPLDTGSIAFHAPLAGNAVGSGQQTVSSNNQSNAAPVT